MLNLQLWELLQEENFCELGDDTSSKYIYIASQNLNQTIVVKNGVF
jgi:hypothetical protein